VPRALAAVLLALALLAGGCGTSADNKGSGLVSGVSRSDDDGYTGVLLPKAYVAPDASLTTDDGKPFSMTKDTSGRLSLVFFGYTQCPDVCQIVMGTIASAVAKLDAADRARVQVLFVTTDPGRDTGAVLTKYLSRLNPAFVGLTGSIDRIDTVGKPFDVFIKKGAKLPSGGYDVSHTTSVIALGGAGRAPLVWDATTSPSGMAKDIKRLLTQGVDKNTA
jgi:protein SCO1/2